MAVDCQGSCSNRQDDYALLWNPRQRLSPSTRVHGNKHSYQTQIKE